MKKELLRKAFHCLSLAYLLAYHVFGWGGILRFLGGFLLIEGSIEYLRLRRPAMNDALMKFFGGIHREKETARFTGMWWTALGCFIGLLFFGGYPQIIDATFLYLCFGDGVAALAGKSFGRRIFTLGGRRKSLEGSLACLAVCLVSGWAAGLTGIPLWAGAAAATLVELLPVPFDDNLWLPAVSGLVLFLLRPA